MDARIAAFAQVHGFDQGGNFPFRHAHPETVAQCLDRRVGQFRRLAQAVQFLGTADRAHHAELAVHILEHGARQSLLQCHVGAVSQRTDKADTHPIKATLAHHLGDGIGGVGARPTDFTHRRHDPRHRHMIEKLKDNDGIAVGLEQNKGLARAGPVGQPVDIGGKTASAVNQKSVKILALHQRLNLGVARRYFSIGKNRKI